MNEKIRQSNFELLRIISIIMIIGLHYLNTEMGGALKYVTKNSLNYTLTHSLESMCIVGVNCFILISAYFMIKKDSINTNKILKLLISLVFYSVIFYVISIIIGKQQFSIKETLCSIVPFFAGRRWFVSTYIILFLLSPYINKVLNNISKKSFEILLLIQFVLFSFWPTFLTNPPIKDSGYGIVNFIFLYCIGSYIRLYYDKKIKNYKYLLIYFAMAAFSTVISFISLGRAWEYDSCFNIVGAVALFLLFRNMPNITSNFINSISKHTFGVFIIHSDFMLKEFFYRDIMKCQNFYDSKLFILHFFVCVILSFIICTIIDVFKEKIFEKTIYKAIKKIKILNLEIKV